MLLRQCEFMKIDYARAWWITLKSSRESWISKSSKLLSPIESSTVLLRCGSRNKKRKEKYEMNYLKRNVETPPETLRRHQTQTAHHISDFPDLTIQLEQIEYEVLKGKLSQVSSEPSRSTRREFTEIFKSGFK